MIYLAPLITHFRSVGFKITALKWMVPFHLQGALFPIFLNSPASLWGKWPFFGKWFIFIFTFRDGDQKFGETSYCHNISQLSSEGTRTHSQIFQVQIQCFFCYNILQCHHHYPPLKSPRINDSPSFSLFFALLLLLVSFNANFCVYFKLTWL